MNAEERARRINQPDQQEKRKHIPYWHCGTCNTIIAAMIVGSGSVVEIKCKKCGTLNRVDRREAA